MVLRPSNGREPLDGTALSADPRAHKTTRAASDMTEPPAQRGEQGRRPAAGVSRGEYSQAADSLPDAGSAAMAPPEPMRMSGRALRTSRRDAPESTEETDGVHIGIPALARTKPMASSPISRSTWTAPGAARCGALFAHLAHRAGTRVRLSQARALRLSDERRRHAALHEARPRYRRDLRRAGTARRPLGRHDHNGEAAGGLTHDRCVDIAPD